MYSVPRLSGWMSIAVGAVFVSPAVTMACDDAPCPAVIDPGPIRLHVGDAAVDFGAGQIPAIPADFFDPGSEPFTGPIQLCPGGADPLQDNGNLVIDRLQPLNLPRVDDQDTVPIQVVELNLQSCQPITVVTDGADVLWDVQVDLGGQPQQPGQMSATKTHDSGGTFSADLLVRPIFTFTRVSDQQQVQFDPGGNVDLRLDVDPWTCEPFCAPSLAEPFYLEPFTPSFIEPVDGVTMFMGAEQAQRGCGPCIAPDNGTGTTDVPAACAYVAPSVADWFVIDGGFPAGTTLMCNPFIHAFQIQNTFNGGLLGGEVWQFQGELHLDVFGTGSLNGYNRSLDMQFGGEIHIGPRTPGDPEQVFDAEFVQFTGQLFGDPDFQQFEFRAGGNLGLPSPGVTGLTQLPGGDFTVDSFFDVSWEIEFQGAPGSPLDGTGGISAGQSKVVQGPFFADPPTIFDGLENRRLGEGVLICDANDQLIVSNIGSSGQDGVSVDLGDSAGWSFEVPEAEAEALDFVEGSPAFDSLFQWDLMNNEIRLDFSFEDPFATYEFRLYDNVTLAAELSTSAPLTIDPIVSGPISSGPINVLRWIPPAPNTSGLDLMLQAILPSGSYQLGGQAPVQADRLVIGIDFSTPIPTVGVVDVRAANSAGDGSVTIGGEGVNLFDSTHRGIGDAHIRPTAGVLPVENIGSSGQDGVDSSRYFLPCEPGYQLPARQPCFDIPAAEYQFSMDPPAVSGPITIDISGVGDDAEEAVVECVSTFDAPNNETRIDVIWHGYDVTAVDWFVLDNGVVVGQGQFVDPLTSIIIGDPLYTPPLDLLLLAPPSGGPLAPTCVLGFGGNLHSFLTPPGLNGTDLMLQAVVLEPTGFDLQASQVRVTDAAGGNRLAAGGPGVPGDIVITNSRFLRARCPADCAPPGGNATVNIDDLVAVVNAISTQDLACDVTPLNVDLSVGNGFVNFDDLIEVVNSFGSCP